MFFPTLFILSLGFCAIHPVDAASDPTDATVREKELLLEFEKLYTHNYRNGETRNGETRNGEFRKVLQGAGFSSPSILDQVPDFFNRGSHSRLSPRIVMDAEDRQKVFEAVEKHIVVTKFFEMYREVQGRKKVFDSLMKAADNVVQVDTSVHESKESFKQLLDRRTTVALRRHVDAVFDASASEKYLVAAFFAAYAEAERYIEFTNCLNAAGIDVSQESVDAFLYPSKTLAMFDSNRDEVFYALREIVDTKRPYIVALLIVNVISVLPYLISVFIKLGRDTNTRSQTFISAGFITGVPHWLAIFFISYELASPGAMRSGILWGPGILYTICLIGAVVLYLCSNKEKKDGLKNKTSWVIYCSFLGPLIAWVVTMCLVPAVEDSDLTKSTSTVSVGLGGDSD